MEVGRIINLARGIIDSGWGHETLAPALLHTCAAFSFSFLFYISLVFYIYVSDNPFIFVLAVLQWLNNLVCVNFMLVQDKV